MKLSFVFFFVFCFVVSPLTFAAKTPVKSECTFQDEESIFQAKLLVAEKEFSEAHQEVSKISATCLTRPEVATLAASIEIGGCGFKTYRFLNAKVMIRYATLINPEFLEPATHPALCQSAVSRLESLAQRSQEQNLVLASAATGLLATRIRAQADQDQNGEIDPGFSTCTAAQSSEKNILELFEAQRTFLKYAPVFSARPDLSDISFGIRRACGRATMDCEKENLGPSAMQMHTMRGLFNFFLEVSATGSCPSHD